MNRAAPVMALSVALAWATTAPAAIFLDLDTQTAGPTGTFSGNLNGVTVNGSISIPKVSYSFQAVGTSFSDSTIDNSSPQYSYAGIFNPTAPTTDRVGYAKDNNAFETAQVTITFASAVLDPVFHVAHLDGSQITFVSTGGLTGIGLLSGNGGGGDGLGISGFSLFDIDPSTNIGVSPATPPPTTGARSAYGSVQLLGNLTSVVFNVASNGGGDGGSFTLSVSPAAVAAAPEPSTLASAGIAGLIGLGVAWRRRQRTA